MMTDTGGPAYPGKVTKESKPSAKTGLSMSRTWQEDVPGMTLLDYFAGLAMEAILSSEAGKGAVSEIGKEEGASNVEVLAIGAYQMAEAMIAEKCRREEK